MKFTHTTRSLKGELTVHGDKSISGRGHYGDHSFSPGSRLSLDD